MSVMLVYILILILILIHIYNAPHVRQLNAESEARVVFLGGHPSKY